MGQVDGLQVVWHVGGDGPEAVVAQVERLEARQRVVDEHDALQLVVRQVQELEVPVIRRVVLVQGAQEVTRGSDVPQGARQGRGQRLQPVVGHVQGSQVGVVAQLTIHVLQAVKMDATAVSLILVNSVSLYSTFSGKTPQ